MVQSHENELRGEVWVEASRISEKFSMVNVSYKDWMFEVSWQTDGLDLLFGLLWIERLLADIQHCVVCVFCVDENAMCIYQSQNSNKERRENKWKRW